MADTRAGTENGALSPGVKEVTMILVGETIPGKHDTEIHLVQNERHLKSCREPRGDATTY